MLLVIDWIGRTPLTITLQVIGLIMLALMLISAILPRTDEPRVTYAEELRERLRKGAASK